MHNLLDFRLALDGPAPDLTDLADADIVRQFPALGIVALTLFVVGLGCDFYLVNRYRQRQPGRLFKVGARPWGVQELAVLGMVYIALNLLVAVTASLFAIDDELAWFLVLTGNLLVSLGMLAGLIVYLRHRAVDFRQAFGLYPATRAGGWAAGLLFYFAMIPPLVIVSVGYAAVCAALDVSAAPQPVVELMGATNSPFLILLVVALAVAVAPIAEEVLFRGFAYPALKRRYGMWRGLVIMSLLFAVVHLHAPSVGPLFALGMAFGLAYELTGTIVAPIIMHSLFNTANVLMLLYVRAQG